MKTFNLGYIGIINLFIISQETVDGFFYKNGSMTNVPNELKRIYPQAICGKGIFLLENENETLINFENDPNCKGKTEIYLTNKRNIKIEPSVNFNIIGDTLFIDSHEQKITISIKIEK